MQASGVKLDRIVANTLMSALGKSGLVDEVSAVFRRMVWGPARLRADRSTFLTVVRVFRECGALSPALHAYNGMRRAGRHSTLPFYFCLLVVYPLLSSYYYLPLSSTKHAPHACTRTDILLL